MLIQQEAFRGVAERSPGHAALGRAVRDIRTELRISQEELAHRSGMDRTYVGGIERGERNPTYHNLRRLSDALDIRFSELLTRAEAIETGD